MIKLKIRVKSEFKEMLNKCQPVNLKIKNKINDDVVVIWLNWSVAIINATLHIYIYIIVISYLINGRSYNK